ncbi:PfkB family carbohydrate kinase [Cellulomonas sp. JH27-2]|uniref:PfkB family carbohydrate kinase n=1 Tax=Cellulomonas sp. JH27-2 TaxID=2774139 RepID=UPI001CD8FB9B|nr:PfkB family carbohydrate kinase [Cellulomonas sp. JH27-2]
MQAAPSATSTSWPTTVRASRSTSSCRRDHLVRRPTCSRRSTPLTSPSSTWPTRPCLCWRQRASAESRCGATCTTTTASAPTPARSRRRRTCCWSALTVWPTRARTCGPEWTPDPRSWSAATGLAARSRWTDGWWEVGAAPVTDVVDTNGAGDAFLAGLLASQGLGTAERLAWASAAGAMAVTASELGAPHATRAAVAALARSVRVCRV